MIGKSPRRKEDERLITGRGRYVDDASLPGLLHLALVRSPHARARILRVDAGAAKSLEGVSVFTADDLPELAGSLPASGPEPTNPYCDFNAAVPHPVLARGENDARGNRERFGLPSRQARRPATPAASCAG